MGYGQRAQQGLRTDFTLAYDVPVLGSILPFCFSKFLVRVASRAGQRTVLFASCVQSVCPRSTGWRGSHRPVNVALKGFGVWVRLVRRLPRPNIAFKGTRLGEAQWVHGFRQYWGVVPALSLACPLI